MTKYGKLYKYIASGDFIDIWPLDEKLTHRYDVIGTVEFNDIVVFIEPTTDADIILTDKGLYGIIYTETSDQSRWESLCK